MKPMEREYRLLREAFRGGNTHANRFLSNKYLKPPEGVGQKDERSAYPAALIFYDYPTKFTKMKTFKQKEFDYYHKQVLIRNYNRIPLNKISEYEDKCSKLLSPKEIKKFLNQAHQGRNFVENLFSIKNKTNA
jgi:hypothetical protein